MLYRLIYYIVGSINLIDMSQVDIISREVEIAKLLPLLIDYS